MEKEYLDIPDFLRNQENLKAEKESEELINGLEKIYHRTGWRDIKQLVIYEAEIKKRLSKLSTT